MITRKSLALLATAALLASMSACSEKTDSGKAVQPSDVKAGCYDALRVSRDTTTAISTAMGDRSEFASAMRRTETAVTELKDLSATADPNVSDEILASSAAYARVHAAYSAGDGEALQQALLSTNTAVSNLARSCGVTVNFTQ